MLCNSTASYLTGQT